MIQWGSEMRASLQTLTGNNPTGVQAFVPKYKQGSRVFLLFFLKRWRAGRFQACLHFKQSTFLDLIFPSQPDFKPPLTNSTNPAYQGSGFQFLSSVICSLWHMATLLITPQYLGISQDPRYNISTTIISKDDSQLQSSGYTQRQMHAHINRTFFWTCEKL